MKTLTCALALAVAMVAGCKSKAGSSGDALAKMGTFKDEMCRCKDAACAQDVSVRMTTWAQGQAKTQPAAMSEADTKKVQAITTELGNCMAAAMTASSGSAAMAAAGSAQAGSAQAGSAAEGSAAVEVDPAAFADLPQECLDYRAAVEHLTSCGDKLPAAVRDVLKQRFDESVEGWKKLPAEAKKSLGPACKAGADAVMANSKQCGS